MKVFLGIFSALVILTAAILGVLAIWEIYPVTSEVIIRSVITLFIVTISLLLLWLVLTLFFKKNKQIKGGGKVAPIN
jgi:hypothetical protein